MRRLLLVPALLVAALLAACGTSSPTPPATKAPATPSLDCRSGYIIVDGRSVCADSAGDQARVRPAPATPVGRRH
jgi:hypothetical protein